MSALSLASFFTVEEREYVHFSLSGAQCRTASGLILALCAGILLAALYTFYQRRVPGGFVRALLRAEALSPETARTLAELGYGKNRLISFELRRNAMLKRLVRALPEAAAAKPADSEGDGDKCNAEGEGTADAGGKAADAGGEAPATDAGGEARYYIPEEDKYRAAVRFDNEGNGVAGLLITAALTVLVAVLLIRLLPFMLTAIDNLMG